MSSKVHANKVHASTRSLSDPCLNGTHWLVQLVVRTQQRLLHKLRDEFPGWEHQPKDCDFVLMAWRLIASFR